MILDYSELLKPIFILNNNMTQSEKINTIIRFILFCGIILALILNNYKIALFVFIIIISLFYLKLDRYISMFVALLMSTLMSVRSAYFGIFYLIYYFVNLMFTNSIKYSL